MLVGGGGNDIFRFDTTPGPGNVDRISDFSAVISSNWITSVFAGLALGAAQRLRLRARHRYRNEGPQIVYNPITGALFFDSDGAAAGGPPSSRRWPAHLVSTPPTSR